MALQWNQIKRNQSGGWENKQAFNAMLAAAIKVLICNKEGGSLFCASLRLFNPIQQEEEKAAEGEKGRILQHITIKQLWQSDNLSHKLFALGEMLAWCEWQTLQFVDVYGMICV